MAQDKQDIFSKLQDRGENVVGKYMPAAQRILEAGSSLTKRVDDLTKRVKELAMLEKRVAALEKKVDKLSGPKRTTTKRTTRAKPKPRATAKKTSS
jgi:outer membrane murein-binding lipoprotein Lpp